MHKSSRNWTKEFEKKNALWIHSGNPKQSHVILTSGNHSSGYVDCDLVTSDDVLLTDAVADLLYAFAKQMHADFGDDLNIVDGVVGPATGATKLARFLSEQIMAYTRSDCFDASPTKDPKPMTKGMVFEKAEIELFPGQNVLLCDDVMTTGGSVNSTALAVIALHGKPLPYVLTLVNRSGLKVIGGRTIVSLIEHFMPIWTPKECGLCMLGSKAVRPKGTQNWAKLRSF